MLTRLTIALGFFAKYLLVIAVVSLVLGLVFDLAMIASHPNRSLTRMLPSYWRKTRWGRVQAAIVEWTSLIPCEWEED